MVAQEFALWPGDDALTERGAMHDDAPLPSADLAALTARMARGDEPAWRIFYELSLRKNGRCSNENISMDSP